MAATHCLVAGGSDFLGINLVRMLLGHGVRVRSLDIAPFDYPERGRIEAILGDIRDPGAVRAHGESWACSAVANSNVASAKAGRRRRVFKAIVRS